MGVIFGCVKFEKPIKLSSGEGSIWWRTKWTPQGVWSSGEAEAGDKNLGQNQTVWHIMLL